ncbi:MAG: hypothetical protein A4E32_00084 [Methanomassiliicoccales archaeon PtaU1.Bin124]|nr:MAG: hypothetical protein A4E32_00084 [Methanomassiliicoccales archaeon PtaU1.Bin124]
MISLVLVLAMVAVAFGAMLQPVSADDSSSVSIEVTGPTKLGIGVKQMYKFIVSGGPAVDGPNGNYSWTASLSGKYAGTAKLSASSGGPSTNGTFFMNVTAPSTAGTFYVTIIGKSANATTNNTQTYKLTIDAVNPIVLKATIDNAANVTVKAVPVSFYFGESTSGDLIYNTTVDVAALSKATVSYNWTTYSLSNGKHFITVAIDPNSTFVTLLDTGAKTQTLTIYYGASGYEGLNAWLWAFVVVLGVLFFLIYRQPTKYKKKGVKGAGKTQKKK